MTALGGPMMPVIKMASAAMTSSAIAETLRGATRAAARGWYAG